MRSHRPHDRRKLGALARTILALLLGLGLPSPLARAAAPAPWRLLVGGEHLPSARLERPDGVLTADLVAVGAALGLRVVRDRRTVTVHAPTGATWTSTVGASFFDGPTTRVFLERPLALDGAAIVVPLEAIATLSGHFVTLLPNAREVDLVAPLAPTTSAFTIAKSPEALAEMRAADARDAPAPPAAHMGESAPPDRASMRVRAGASYVIGADAAFSAGADGSLYGVDTRFDVSTTHGARGHEVLTGRLTLDDPDLGWSLSAGDLTSRLWGSARGVRASYELLDGWRPTLTAYLPWERSANRDLVLSWAEHLDLGAGATFDAEVASDTSLFAQLGLLGDAWMVGAAFSRRPGRGDRMRHEGSLYGSVRGPAGVSMAARVHVIDPDHEAGSVRAHLTLAWPILKVLRATLSHGSLMSAESWSHHEHLALALQAGALKARLAYLLTLRQAPVPADGMLSSHAATAGAGVRLGGHLSLDGELNLNGRPDGSVRLAGRAFATVRPFRTTTLELSASFPSHRVQVRLRQELPAGFVLGAEYGGVSPHQPVLGAVVDPHLVRVTLTGAWDVATPARGASVSGRLADRDGAPIKGAIVQLERFRVATDDDGAFSFTPLPRGRYVLEVDPTSLPADLVTTGTRREVDITDATESVYYELEALRYSSIWGVMYQDLNDNSIFDPGEGIAGAPVRLGERTTAPGPDGRFVFHNVPPGEHVVRLAVMHIASDYEPAGAVEVKRTLSATGGSPAPVVFRIAKRARRIKFTPLPSDLPDDELEPSTWPSPWPDDAEPGSDAEETAP